MFEFEDISSGFHDVFLNKYADSSGPTLDFYISDSMQDMLDIDIRAEVATVVGGANEFTSLMNDLPSLDLEMGSNDGDISWLGGPKWSPSIGHTTVTTTTTGSANDIYADVGACVNPNSVMPVITSTILNATRSQVNLNTTNYNNNNRSNSPLPSPKEKKSHLTFSPNQIKVPSMQQDKINRTSQLVGNHQQQLLQQQHHQQQQQQSSINNSQGLKSSIDNIKKDLSTELKDEKLIKTTIPNSMPTGIMSNANTIKLAPGIGGLTFANSLAYTKLKQSNLHLKSSVNGNNTNGSIGLQMKRERESSPHNNHINNNVVNGNSIYHNGTTNGHHNSPKMLARNIVVHSKSNGSVINAGNGMNIALANGTTMSHNGNGIPNGIATNGSGTNGTAISKNKIKSGNHEFPKPAYSYSCLIAMALKNSRSGSLPVSEIYSFMCEHFPYFKTAPNGWKNSVRHNLSLNKCFEKIEKPATNGGQRKGCLWAMNPTKISKMDEEVQKWSRKDPMAIRKAMVFPEHLEALERGEMKHGSTGDSDGENDVTSDVEENSDSEQDNEIDDQLIDENLVESQESVDDEDDPEKEYDIEVTDIYDSIDLNDDKEALRMAIRQNDYLEITENDLPIQSKRARLDINYSIGPARVFDNQIHQQQPVQQHQSRRKMQLVNRIV